MQERPSPRPVLAVALAATGFSWGFIIVKGIGLPPSTVAFYRTWAGAIALMGAVLMRGGTVPRIPRGPMLLPVGLAGLCFGLHQLLFISAAQATSISIVTLMQGLQPLCVAIVSHRLLGERVPRGLLGSSMLAVCGVATVVIANQGDESHSAFGDGLAVLNLFAYLGYFLACKRARMLGLDSLTLTAWSLLLAGVVLTPAFAWNGPGPDLQAFQVALILFHAWVPGNGHVLINWAHARISAALASILLSLVPVLASLWAFLLFGEPYGPWHLAGTLATLAAIEAGRRAA